MTDSLFEIVGKEQFEADTKVASDVDSASVRGSGRIPKMSSAGSSDATMTYCEFCKGWYIAEFHHGDTDDVS